MRAPAEGSTLALEEALHRHALAAGALHFEQRERVLCARDLQLFAVAPQLAGHATPAGAQTGAPDLERLAFVNEVSARKRVEGADPPLELGGRPRPVDERLGLLDLVRVGHAPRRLR